MNAPNARKALHHLRPRCSPLALAIVAGLLAPAPAFAQDAPPAEAPLAESPASQPTELDAVVVTAQGREEDILAVPYNISAVSGEAIEQQNILDSAELMRGVAGRSEEHTSELQSLMRNSYAVFCLKKKNTKR